MQRIKKLNFLSRINDIFVISILFIFFILVIFLFIWAKDLLDFSIFTVAMALLSLCLSIYSLYKQFYVRDPEIIFQRPFTWNATENPNINFEEWTCYGLVMNSGDRLTFIQLSKCSVRLPNNIVISSSLIQVRDSIHDSQSTRNFILSPNSAKIVQMTFRFKNEYIKEIKQLKRLDVTIYYSFTDKKGNFIAASRTISTNLNA